MVSPVPCYTIADKDKFEQGEINPIRIENEKGMYLPLFSSKKRAMTYAEAAKKESQTIARWVPMLITTVDELKNLVIKVKEAGANYVGFDIVHTESGIIGGASPIDTFLAKIQRL